jgi:hypothetical protein
MDNGNPVTHFISKCDWFQYVFHQPLTGQGVSLFQIGLIALRIWHVSRDATPSLVSTDDGSLRQTNKLEYALRIVVESALLYTACTIALLCTAVARSNAEYVVMDSVSPWFHTSNLPVSNRDVNPDCPHRRHLLQPNHSPRKLARTGGEGRRDELSCITVSSTAFVVLREIASQWRQFHR